MNRATAALVFAALVALAPPGAAEPPAPVPEAVRTAWGFDRSDLAPHPDVRFGVLANGMRYALMRNNVPAGGLSVRMRIDVGATAEGEREQGFVHLIEHLIFEGSSNIPKGALPPLLVAGGLESWSDFNAFTSFDQTVYRLDLARADGRAREATLTLMGDIAMGLKFTRANLAGARKMVRDEIRGRSGIEDRVMAAQHAFFLPGTPLDRGPVAGTEASVDRASRAALERLYRLYYAPQRTTLVMVGDFDPAAVEAEISARFSAWPRTAEAAAAPTASAPQIRTDRGTEVRLLVDPVMPTRVTVARVAPLGSAADTGSGRTAQFLELLATGMLNRRLAAAAAGQESPFVRAESDIYVHFGTARIATIEATARHGNWLAALQGGANELRRALAGGFSQAELDAQLAATRNDLTRRAGPMGNVALADAIIDAVGRGLVFTQPAGTAATADYLAKVRLEDVNAAFRAAWAGTGRLIFVSHDRDIEGGEAAIAAAWNSGEPAAAALPRVSTSGLR